jgi:CRISPR-associated protein Cas5d
MSQQNKITVRVWGDYACFTRPEMKVERVSYPVCTPSAARGVLEAIFWEPEIHYIIDSIAVIKKGRWFSFRRNEVSTVISIKEAQKWMKGSKGVKYIEAGGGGEDAAQRNMLALADVEYLITAEILPTKKRSKHPLGVYVEEVQRRARKGKCYHRPGLGCREFTADFDLVEYPNAGIPAKWETENLRKIYEVIVKDKKDEKGNPIQLANWSEDELGIMLYDVFDPVKRSVADEKNLHVKPMPVFFHAKIKDSVMDCHPDRTTLLRPQAKGVE